MLNLQLEIGQHFDTLKIQNLQILYQQGAECIITATWITISKNQQRLIQSLIRPSESLINR